MSKIYKYLIGSLGVILMILFVFLFPDITAWILISVVIAMIGSPLVEFLSKIRFRKLIFPRWLAAIITLGAFYSIIFLFFWFFIPLVAGQINEFRKLDVTLIEQGFDEPIRVVDSVINDYHLSADENFSVRQIATEKIQSIVNFSSVSNFLSNVTSTISTSLLGLFAISFISFFFLKEKYLFDRGVIAMMPEKVEEKTRNVLASIRKLISRYFIGLILEIICVMSLITGGLTLLGLKFELAILIGMFAGVFNIIPFLGPWIAAALGILLTITGNIGLDFNSEILPLIYKLIAVFVVVRLIDDFILQPLIYSKSVKAHPLEIFLVIIVAASIGGVIGMMLAIPVYTVLRVIAKEFFNHFKFVQEITKNMSIPEDKKP
ncbi:MAG: AI-2E family transporter [Bacteroidales bacterium]|nr:AI-2E family transporter [Bacteroidales bacterium]HOY39537.1 AI-2E family transporter [Bacteroidales bacterium]HQP04611.1 AI-2E family transporter [Bacteroidales bacterium]